MNTSASAALTASSPPRWNPTSSSGSVTTRPPPMSSVNRYWLHEIRKANAAAIARPGAIIGSVTRVQTASGEAPRVRACASSWTSKLAKLPVSIRVA